MPTLDELAAKIKAAEELWLKTSRPDGTTAAFPLWFVHDGQRLYFLTAESSSEVWHVKRSPVVEVAIGAPDGPDRLKMQADVMAEPNWVPMMIDLLQKKYGVTHRERMERTAQAAKSGHVIVKLKPV